MLKAPAAQGTTGAASSGGFRSGAAAFRNSKEGFLLEQDSIHRSVALAQAIEFCKQPPGATSSRDVLANASEFYDWLLKPAKQSHAERWTPTPGEGWK